MAIITLDQYKEYAGISSPKNDDQLQALVDYADSLITNYCNTSFSPVSVTDKRLTVLHYEEDVIIPNSPVISIDTINIMFGSSIYAPVDIAECVIDYDLGILTLPYGQSMPSRKHNVSISYTYGYAQVPAAVENACLELVTYMSKREFVKSKGVDGQSANFSDPKVLPTHIRTSLDLFRVL